MNLHIGQAARLIVAEEVLGQGISELTRTRIGASRGFSFQCKGLVALDRPMLSEKTISNCLMDGG